MLNMVCLLTDCILVKCFYEVMLKIPCIPDERWECHENWSDPRPNQYKYKPIKKKNYIQENCKPEYLPFSSAQK